MYSIWFLPSEEYSSSFKTVLDTLAQQYSGPAFHPHVTLLGHLPQPADELRDIMKQVASTTAPFTMDISHIEGIDYFFRCLYFRIQDRPLLTRIHEQAKSFFPHQTWEPFMPHLSILYADLDQKKKQKIIRNWNLPYPPAFTVNRLQLARISDEVENWKILYTVDLKKESV